MRYARAISGRARPVRVRGDLPAQRVGGDLRGEALAQYRREIAS
jgi:hypothetical protein